MSGVDKDKQRLLSAKYNLKFNDLVRILGKLGYMKQQGGQATGSAVSFYDQKTKDIIFMHRPHPSPEVDRGCLKSIVKHLKEVGKL